MTELMMSGWMWLVWALISVLVWGFALWLAWTVVSSIRGIHVELTRIREHLTGVR